MTDSDMRPFASLFPSDGEMEKRTLAAKQLRIAYLHGIASEYRGKFLSQSRRRQVAGASALATAGAVGLFWAALVASPKPTEAEQQDVRISPTQLTLGAPRTLPSFEDTHQRHTGILDTLHR